MPHHPYRIRIYLPHVILQVLSFVMATHHPRFENISRATARSLVRIHTEHGNIEHITHNTKLCITYDNRHLQYSLLKCIMRLMIMMMMVLNVCRCRDRSKYTCSMDVLCTNKMTLKVPQVNINTIAYLYALYTNLCIE